MNGKDTAPGLKTMPGVVRAPLDARQLAAYQEWERSCQSQLPGRYSVELHGQPLFELELDDVPVLLPGFRLEAASSGVTMHAGNGPSGFSATVSDLSAADGERIFSTVDGKRSLGDICAMLHPTYSEEKIKNLFQALLGTALGIPATLEHLRRRIFLAEIVRFPMQSPYTILRAYWRNSGDARAAVGHLRAAAAEADAFPAALAQMHVLTTMGISGNSFYGGSGGIPTVPGGLREVRVRTGLAAPKAAFLNDYLGSLGYGGLRAETTPEYTTEGLELGFASNDGGIFHHPDPAGGAMGRLLEHLRNTFNTLNQAVQCGDKTKIPAAAADFHKLFLHIHPFYNINNSVAMNIVNACLREAKHGIIPHLLLDFTAMRTDFETYRNVFRYTLENLGLHPDQPGRNRYALKRIQAYHRQLLDHHGHARLR